MSGDLSNMARDLQIPSVESQQAARMRQRAEAAAMAEELWPTPKDPRMDPAQVGKLLAKLESLDGRQVGKTTVRAWWSLLGHLPYRECLAAIEPFYLRNARRMTPSDFQDAVGGHMDEPAWRPHI